MKEVLTVGSIRKLSRVLCFGHDGNQYASALTRFQSQNERFTFGTKFLVRRT